MGFIQQHVEAGSFFIGRLGCAKTSSMADLPQPMIVAPEAILLCDWSACRSQFEGRCVSERGVDSLSLLSLQDSPRWRVAS